MFAESSKDSNSKHTQIVRARQFVPLTHHIADIIDHIALWKRHRQRGIFLYNKMKYMQPLFVLNP